MNHNFFLKTEAHIKSIQSNVMMTLFEYFDNSSDFTLYSEKSGLEVPLNTNSVTYVDGEMDDRNKYKEYIANDGSFIIRVDVYAIRQGKHLWSSDSRLSLEKVENLESEILIFRVTCK